VAGDFGGGAGGVGAAAGAKAVTAARREALGANTIT